MTEIISSDGAPLIGCDPIRFSLHQRPESSVYLYFCRQHGGVDLVFEFPDRNDPSVTSLQSVTLRACAK